MMLSMMLAGLQSCKVHTVNSRKPASVSPEWTYDVAPSVGNRVESTDAQTRELMAEARKWLGTKYRYGGHSRSGTDCSGMIMELFRKVYGLKLPRSSAQQQAYSVRIRRDELRAGDLLFFDTTKGRRGVSHVGLYMGGGEMIHASGSRGVIVSRIDERYYKDRYHSSGRVLAFASGGKQRNESRVREVPGSKRKQEPVPNPNPVIMPPAGYVDPAMPVPAIEPPDTMPTLDDVLNSKIDSIYSSMMD